MTLSALGWSFWT